MTRGGPAPALSVVVPTYRRPARLAACLAALSHHDLADGAVEVVVVDDGSPAADAAAVERAVAAVPARLPVRLHRQANTGPAGARNAGAAVASAERVAFTDDDCAPAPSWPARLLAHLDAAPSALVGGRTHNALPANLFAQASQDLLTALYRAGPTHPQVSFFASNNIAMLRRPMLELGGFDVAFPGAAGEDRDLCERWQAAGRPLRHAPDAVVAHFHDMGLRGYWRQHRGYGRGAAQLGAVRARRGSGGPRVEGPRFYLRLLTEPYRHGAAPRATAVAGLVALSQVATATGYVAERRRLAGARPPVQAGRPPVRGRGDPDRS